MSEFLSGIGLIAVVATGMFMFLLFVTAVVAMFSENRELRDLKTKVRRIEDIISRPNR